MRNVIRKVPNFPRLSNHVCLSSHCGFRDDDFSGGVEAVEQLSRVHERCEAEIIDVLTRAFSAISHRLF